MQQKNGFQLKTRKHDLQYFELLNVPNIKLFRTVWSDSFLNLSNVMFCSNVLIVAAVAVAVAMVAVVGLVVVVIRSGTIIMHDRVALVLAQVFLQQQVRIDKQNKRPNT